MIPEIFSEKLTGADFDLLFLYFRTEELYFTKRKKRHLASRLGRNS